MSQILRLLKNEVYMAAPASPVPAQAVSGVLQYAQLLLEERKGAPQHAYSDVSQSSGILDASVLVQDAHRRRQVERPSLFKMVIIDSYHKAAVRRLKDVLVPSRKEYIRYLLGLKHDIAIVEGALQKDPPKDLKNLQAVYRSEAIEKDLAALKVTDEQPSVLIDAFWHKEHLTSIKDKPHRLIAHLAVNHLGFMYGGQMTSASLKAQEWGENSVALYQFPDLSNLLPAFSTELTRYLHNLSEDQFQEFTQEMPTAWQFACDTESLNMRA